MKMTMVAIMTMMTTSSWLWNWEEVGALWEPTAGTTAPLTADDEYDDHHEDYDNTIMMMIIRERLKR